MLKERNALPEIFDHHFNVDVAKIAPIFSRVTERVHSSLDIFRRSINEEGIKYLKSCYHRPVCPKIDYDNLAIPFAYRYFTENFWKAVSVFIQEAPPLTHSVLDVGCGSATVTIAYLSALDALLPESKWNIDVTFLDRSKAQLELAGQILKCAQIEFKNLRITAHFICRDLKLWEPQEQSTDVVLLGHVLNENWNYANSLLEKADSAARGKGRIYVIEREYDKIWAKINDDYISRSAFPARLGTTRFESGSLSSNLSEISEKDNITTGYMVIDIPEKKRLAYLLKKYFTAWSDQRVDLLEEIFEQDAEYWDKPYQAPKNGIKEIELYWKENVLSQRDVAIRILNVAYYRDCVFAEWEAKFSRQEKNQVKGTLILEAKNDRVHSLREYYDHRKQRGKIFG